MASLEQMPDKEEDLSQMSTYLRGKGVANEKGTGFEYKMALLFYLRAKRLTEKFWLGVNVQGIDGFDDLVLIYMHNNAKYRLQIQLKHKVKTDFTIKVSDLIESGAKGKAFSLEKYFNSVKGMLGELDRTHLVLFTNTTLQKPLQAITELNPLAEEFLSTGGNKNLMYKMSVDDEVCKFRSESGAEEFVDKFVFCCRQANVDEVDHLIKREILFHFRRIVPDLDSRYSELLEGIKEWWGLDGETEYLRENWDVWTNLRPESSLFDDIHFKEDADILQLLDSHKVHLMYSGVDVQLRSLKVLQALQTKTNLTFFFTTLEDIMKENENSNDDHSCSTKEKSLVQMWQDEKFDLLAVDTYTESKDVEDVVNELKMLEGIVNENRRLLLISDGNLPSEFGEEWISRTDTCTLHQLDEPSKERVERLWESSPNKAEVLSRDTTGELLCEFLLVYKRKEYLLEADRNGDTRLQLAVARQNPDMVELLLEMGADTAPANKYGDNPLLIACRKPRSDIVEILLKHGALTTTADHKGDSPLIIAIRNGYTDTVKLLLEYNAPPTDADKFGRTPLMIAAAESKSDEIVDLLLKHGAATRSDDMDRALDLAVKAKDAKSVKIFLDIIMGSKLLIAVSDGSTEIVKLFLERNAPTTATTTEGDTALLIAVKKGYPAIVKHLIEHGASVNLTDRCGLSPLQIAERENHGEIVEILRGY